MTAEPVRTSIPTPHRHVHGPIKRFLARAWLALNGFRFEGQRPAVEKYVLIAAPHTSNWDLVFMLANSWLLDMRLQFMAKHTLFEGPLGGFYRWLGGIPVDRRSPQNLVEQMAGAFAKTDSLVLAVPPEGTRKRVEYWKTGFYYIALAAGVPIVPSVLDFGNKVAKVLPPFMPTGDLQADMAHLRGIYEGVVPKVPAKYGPVRVRTEENASPVASPRDAHARSNTSTSAGSRADNVMEA